jgi:hypothetical protein
MIPSGPVKKLLGVYLCRTWPVFTEVIPSAEAFPEALQWGSNPAGPVVPVITTPCQIIDPGANG